MGSEMCIRDRESLCVKFYRSPRERFLGHPVGHIHEREDFWKDYLLADDYILRVLKEGYRLSFDRSKLPESYQEANNKSALDEMEFVREELKKLEDRGCVVKWDYKPRLVNPLTVVNKNGKKRLVIDLSRCLNLLLYSKKFKICLLYTSPSPRDLSTSRMPSSA